MAAFAIDIGYHRVVRNQLQNAADAAALAGAGQMGKNYLTPTPTPSANVATVASATATLNIVAGTNLPSNKVNTQIGTWNTIAKTFAPSATNQNAVKVTTNITYNTFFASVLNAKTLSSEATAWAALTGQCSAIVDIPLVLGTGYFGGTNTCHDIVLNGSDSCAGWSDLSYAGEHDSDNVYKKAKTLIEHPDRIPKLSVDDTVGLAGGNPKMEAFYDAYRDNRDSKKEWLVSIAVYDNDGCSNPNQSGTIKGFTLFTITDVDEDGRTIKGAIACDHADPNRGGCTAYGNVFGATPGLVK
jgi:hypothetical protein